MISPRDVQTSEKVRRRLMKPHAKVLKRAFVGTVGIAAAVSLAFLMVQFAAPKAEATPAIGQGKPCTACHTSSSPSKNDLKK